MKFLSICLFAIFTVINLSFGTMKIHFGTPVFRYGQGYEIGINKTIFELGFLDFETGVKASFITDDYRVLLQKAFPVDVVYYEKQRLFYTSVPLDVLIVYKGDGFSPFIKFQNQIDALVYKNVIRVENEESYRNRLRESRLMFRLGGSLGSMFRILDQYFQVDVGLLVGVTPFKTGAYNRRQYINSLNFKIAYLIQDM